MLDRNIVSVGSLVTNVADTSRNDIKIYNNFNTVYFSRARYNEYNFKLEKKFEIELQEKNYYIYKATQYTVTGDENFYVQFEENSINDKNFTASIVGRFTLYQLQDNEAKVINANDMTWEDLRNILLKEEFQDTIVTYSYLSIKNHPSLRTNKHREEIIFENEDKITLNGYRDKFEFEKILMHKNHYYYKVTQIGQFAKTFYIKYSKDKVRNKAFSYEVFRDVILFDITPGIKNRIRLTKNMNSQEFKKLLEGKDIVTEVNLRSLFSKEETKRKRETKDDVNWVYSKKHKGSQNTSVSSNSIFRNQASNESSNNTQQTDQSVLRDNNIP